MLEMTLENMLRMTRNNIRNMLGMTRNDSRNEPLDIRIALGNDTGKNTGNGNKNDSVNYIKE